MVAAKEIDRGVKEVLLGASMRQVADDYRDRLIDDFGFREEEVTPGTFKKEVAAYMRALARHLGDRHQGDVRVGEALAPGSAFLLIVYVFSSLQRVCFF